MSSVMIWYMNTLQNDYHNQVNFFSGHSGQGRYSSWFWGCCFVLFLFLGSCSLHDWTPAFLGKLLNAMTSGLTTTPPLQALMGSVLDAVITSSLSSQVLARITSSQVIPEGGQEGEWNERERERKEGREGGRMEGCMDLDVWVPFLLPWQMLTHPSVSIQNGTSSWAPSLESLSSR